MYSRVTTSPIVEEPFFSPLGMMRNKWRGSKWDQRVEGYPLQRTALGEKEEEREMEEENNNEGGKVRVMEYW